jgi:hypothetical protein
MKKFNHHTMDAFHIDLKQLIHVKHHIQSNNVKQHVTINEHTQNSIYIDITINKSKMLPQFLFFLVKGFF